MITSLFLHSKMVFYTKTTANARLGCNFLESVLKWSIIHWEMML